MLSSLLAFFYGCAKEEAFEIDDAITFNKQDKSNLPISITKQFRGLYVDNLKTILRDSVRTKNLVAFIKEKNFRYLSLYEAAQLLDTIGGKELLSSFIQKARTLGVKEISASGGSRGEFNNFREYNLHYADTVTMQIDIFNLELEFWNNNCSFQEWLEVAQIMKSLSDGKRCEAYLSGQSNAIDSKKLQKIVNLDFDRLLVSCYTHYPESSFNWNRTFYNLFNKLKMSEKQKIMPIFSAESQYMGADLNMTTVEISWKKGYQVPLFYENCCPNYTQKTTITGYMYFAYTFF